MKMLVHRSMPVAVLALCAAALLAAGAAQADPASPDSVRQQCLRNGGTPEQCAAAPQPAPALDPRIPRSPPGIPLVAGKPHQAPTTSLFVKAPSRLVQR